MEKKRRKIAKNRANISKLRNCLGSFRERLHGKSSKILVPYFTEFHIFTNLITKNKIFKIFNSINYNYSDHISQIEKIK